ncbi:GNAT family N-acetyltransferase [Actinomyces oris]|uniref:GNAT family N-acetyltransferase n=1 Tax=Actinomyces oris TaxID=544580 RepID=UPI00094CD518|nr:GNAT family N-acetyltransferase [Actinomyces oris]OLO74848.1 GNAT family N-acetyltransferase [Actinomyces oris]
MTINLKPLEAADRESFIADLQEAFEHFVGDARGSFIDVSLPEDGTVYPAASPILPREDIEDSLSRSEVQALRIIEEGTPVGGVMLSVKGDRGEIEILAINASTHGRGIGARAWTAIEEAYPNVREWELVTPYFEVRNIHFYVNKCGFHIVEFFNEHHPAPSDSGMDKDLSFRFVKYVRRPE